MLLLLRLIGNILNDFIKSPHLSSYPLKTRQLHSFRRTSLCDNPGHEENSKCLIILLGSPVHLGCSPGH